jgi:hypothetical protein
VHSRWHTWYVDVKDKMTNYIRGQSNVFVAQFYAYQGGAAINPTGLTVEFKHIITNTTVQAPTSIGIQNPSTGIFTYAWNIPSDAVIGDYIAIWSGTYAAQPISASEIFGVIATSSDMGSGPCELWPAVWQCELDGASIPITGAALQAASEILWALSGRRFGLCTTTVRPCRRGCSEGFWGGGYWPEGIAGVTYPTPVKIGAQWLNLVCGYCTSGCSCAQVEEAVLPAPVYDILQVKVDGVVLEPGVDYRLDEHRLLVRLGGESWPLCNDLRYADTEVGTWSVTARFGEAVPVLGTIAAGELACEFVKALRGDDCLLPDQVTSLVRQGVSINYADTAQLLEGGRLGLRFADMFLSSVNPSGLRHRSQVYDVDGPGYRITG